MDNSSIGPSNPTGTTNCCPDITKASPSVFELKNPLKEMNFIYGELDNGELVFDVQNRPKQNPQDGCPGKWMFEQMWAHFGSNNITVIIGFWTGPNSDNLIEFNNQIGAGMTEQQAAWLTWTGRRATEKGFTHVDITSKTPSSGSGPFTTVLLKFTK